ncbi:MAG: SDR family oxidoreductase [Bacteroidetes bacterium]|nr:MAG: SDR family oxidoreductase [Bacteroidota bacterium]
MKVEGKVWVVTGGGSGMGRELVLLLLKRGAKVATLDINGDSLAETAKLAGDRAQSLSTHVLDITDREKVHAFPEEVIKIHGAVDAIINNAGIIQPFIKVNELEYDVIERIININFYGTLYMVKAFLPHLLKREEGYIANISSMGGFLPVPGQTFYGASKAGVKLLTEGLHSELMETNVRVSCIFPGAIDTNITANSGVETPGHEKADASKFKTLPAPEAARIMLDGIEKNKYHIFVGKDSSFMNKLWRLAPERAAKLIYSKMKALLN